MIHHNDTYQYESMYMPEHRCWYYFLYWKNEKGKFVLCCITTRFYYLLRVMENDKGKLNRKLLIIQFLFIFLLSATIIITELT